MKCQNCQKHSEDLGMWVGDGNALSAIHGNYTYWCNCCMLKANLKYAKKQARNITRLEKRLKNIKCK